jgi:replicative DNA helicase
MSRFFDDLILKLDDCFQSGIGFQWAAFGLPQLDGGLGEALMQPDTITIVGGTPGGGKTAFAIQVARANAEAGLGVIFMSLEMSALSLSKRVMTQLSGVNHQKLRTGKNLYQKDLSAISKARAAHAEMLERIIIMDAAGWSGMRAAEAAKDGAVQFGSRGTKLGLVIIDYVQLLTGEGNTRELVVSSSMDWLRKISKDLQVPVLALAQVNRSQSNRPDRTPQSSDLRESGKIEAAADTILFVHRPYLYDHSAPQDHAELIFRKVRDGETGTVTVRFIGDQTRFEDLPKSTIVQSSTTPHREKSIAEENHEEW